jgi:hypothetical protein
MEKALLASLASTIGSRQGGIEKVVEISPQPKTSVLAARAVRI